MHEQQMMRYFCYLDDEGLSSLFAQTGKPYIESLIRKKGHGTTGRVSGKIKMGAVLSLLGIGEGEAGADIDHERTYTTEATELLRPEHKLKAVMDALRGSGSLTTVDTSNMGDRALTSGGFVDLTGTFDTSDFLVIKPLAEDPLAALPCQETSIIMGTSLRKYTLNLRHLRIAWSIGRVKLRVFGVITSRGEGFYLKPFAISQV